MIRATDSFVFVELPVFAASSILLKRHSQFEANALVSLNLRIHDAIRGGLLMPMALATSR